MEDFAAFKKQLITSLIAIKPDIHHVFYFLKNGESLTSIIPYTAFLSHLCTIIKTIGIMRTLMNFRTIVVSLLMVFAAQVITAQTFKLDNKSSSLKIDGTSNVHDWTIEAEQMAGVLTATLENGKITNISQLNLTVVAESLKSGKSGMDKNTFKALKTDKHKQISFTLNKVNRIDCGSNGDCKIAANGYVTIAGTRKAVDVIFEAKVSGSKIVLQGSAPIVMSQYNIDPPTAMFGTITTGDKVNVKFQAVFNK